MEDQDIYLPTLYDSEDKHSAIKNRLRKNYNHIKKWAKRTKTNAFRIYDKDIKEYPLAIDFYDNKFCVHYFTSSRDFSGPPESLQQEINKAITDLFKLSAAQIFWRTRIKREKTKQYEKSNILRDFFTVYEYGVRFKVNMMDYLDTGLFLDHRETRQLVARECKGKKLLNLFAYTCSFSVQASFHGAKLTKSVDMSNTYTSWGKDNFLLNNLHLTHNIIVRDDCIKFLDQETLTTNLYDIIVIDPPTISRSKKMDDIFDVQQDYIHLIKKSLRLLESGGSIYFSTNSRKFKFDQESFNDLKIIEITHKTIPLDFHDKKIHKCWKIQRI